MHYWWYFMRFRATRVNKRPVVDPANQRVSVLRPWRPGPILSPGGHRYTVNSKVYARVVVTGLKLPRSISYRICIIVCLRPSASHDLT